MSGIVNTNKGFHGYGLASKGDAVALAPTPVTRYTYTFSNYFHPFVSELVARLNKKSVDGLLDVDFHKGLEEHFFKDLHHPVEATAATDTIDVNYSPKTIDVSGGNAYAGYNWELLFHAPLTVAVHLSKNQRFAEAQRWFHYIFDPTNTDTATPAPQRFWRFLGFRQNTPFPPIDEMLRILSKAAAECSPAELEVKKTILRGYEGIRKQPFQPHVVARTRFLAYQYCVVMKYLDNLIAWGDSLFRQDTMETINEATQLYVLAANLLGPRPQQVPHRGRVRPKSYAELRATTTKTDPFANALVELEGLFPFNLAFPGVDEVDTATSGSLLGSRPTLYFCVPRNEKLLGYWSLVADRLFKIRHCMNIEGVVRQLALFEPPIDPGMLVKAAAAGIDIGSLISGLNQPLSPVRSSLLIQKALEICGEVRGLGSNLLSVLEKRDGEAMALMRQRHEITIQQLAQDVRFLQWKEAEAATDSLLATRKTALDRYRHYQRQLGKSAESPEETLSTERLRLTEENFKEVYGELVGAYSSELEPEAYPPSTISTGALHLSAGEYADLNTHAPEARHSRLAATWASGIASGLALVPGFSVKMAYWGIGGEMELTSGHVSAAVGQVVSGAYNTDAAIEDSHGASASKTASYERRTDNDILQSNLAARELTQIGRQIISSLIREQITQHEYDNHAQQLTQAKEVDDFLRSKFTNDQLYVWMQGELSKLYYECYKLAFDVARRAEQTMKHELMRPELDAISFVKFNYWDGGRKGFLSGETLYLDVKRLELAYHEHNKREYELTKHVSIKQLDPLALLALKATGVAEISLPEWLFDLDCPGHYMRRIKTVTLSIPSVAGPYTSVNCTLSLIRSELRQSALLDDEYSRRSIEDARFVDYYGTVQSIVTSHANNDGGFDANARDERFLPFEGAGAISTWRLELPSEFRQFDYDTIADVIMHLRYTARQAGALRQPAVQSVTDLIEGATTSSLARVFSLKHDFPSEWHAFVAGTDKFTAVIKKEHFPYFVQAREILINRAELYAVTDGELQVATPKGAIPESLHATPQAGTQAELSLEEDATVLVRQKGAHVFLILRYSLG
jgi:hypothetical protein